MSSGEKLQKIEEIKDIFSHGLIQDNQRRDTLTSLLKLVISIIDFEDFKTPELKYMEDLVQTIKRMTFYKIKNQ